MRVGRRVRTCPKVGKAATQPGPPGGSPPLQSKGQKQKWVTGRQGGYIIPATLGATASEWAAESQVAHKWAGCIHDPCRLGRPNCCIAEGRIIRIPQLGKVATLRLMSRGSPSLQSGGKKQKPLTSGKGGHVTPARGFSALFERRMESEVAQKWASWLHSPCPLGYRHRFRAEGRIRSRLEVGKVAT